MGMPRQCPREPRARLRTHLLLGELRAERLSIELHSADLLQPLAQPGHSGELRLQDLLKLQQRDRWSRGGWECAGAAAPGHGHAANATGLGHSPTQSKLPLTQSCREC